MSVTSSQPAELDPSLSQTRGETETPLLETTIGDNRDETAARLDDCEALVDVEQGKRWNWRRRRSEKALHCSCVSVGITGAG